MAVVNSYDKLGRLILRPLFSGKAYRTEVWIGDEASGRLNTWMEEDEEDASDYIDKLEHFAKNWFHNFEGPTKGIRSKGNTWPVILATQPFGLFRLYGFYETAQKKAFLVPSCTMKRGKKMTGADKEECDFASQIKRTGQWVKEPEAQL